MKKFVAIFLTFILIFSFTLPSYANLIEVLDKVEPSTPFDSFDFSSNRGYDITNNSDEAGESVGTFTQIVVDIVNDICSLATKPLMKLISLMPTIEGCIWGTQNMFQLTFFDSATTGIGGSFRSLIGSLYNALRYLVAAFYIIILVYLGIRMILSSIGKQKAHYKTLIQYWLTGLLLLFAFHWVMALIIWTSDTLTFAFATTGQKALASHDEPYTAIINDALRDNSLWGKAKAGVAKVGQAVKDTAGRIISWITGRTDSSGTDSSGTDSGEVKDRITLYFLTQFAEFLGASAIIPGLIIFSLPVLFILIIVFIIFGLVITYTYFKRLLTVALLIVLFPLVVLSYVFDKIGDRRAQTFEIWFKEFTVNVFVQPIHAALLMFIAYILSALVNGVPLAFLRIVLALLSLALIPIGEKQIKTLFQINSSMGPGNGGIASSVAHAGMALKTLQNLGSSLVDMRKKAVSLKNAESFTKDIINKRGNKAFDAARKSGKSIKEANMEKSKAEKDFESKLASSAKYKKKMKELTGHTSLEKARKANTIKTVSGTVFGSIGAGYALATTTSAGDLLGNITKSSIGGAAVANAFVNTAHNFFHAGEPLESPELDEIEKMLEKDLDKLDDSQKKKMAEVLGINKDAINNSKESRKLINRKIAARRQGLKYGLNYDDPNVQYLDEDYDEIQSIMSGFDPRDPSKKINWHNFKKSVTKDGMYLQDIRDGGKLYHIPALANSRASDKIIWQDAGESNEEYKINLGKRAERLADEMADNGAFERGSKQYKNFLKNEQKSMAEHYAAHVKTTDALEKINHNMMAHRSIKMYSSAEKRIKTTDDIREYLNAEQLSDLNSSISELQHNLAFDPNDISSKATTLDAIKHLYNNGSKTSVNNVCAEFGASYDAIANGTIDDESLKNISAKIQQKVGGETFRVACANKLDVNARANEIISSIATDGMISQKSVDFAVSNATQGKVTSLNSQTLQTFLTNSTTAEKQHFINTCNQLMAEERIVSPHTATVAYAQNEGKIATTVNISNSSTDISQLLGNSTQTLGTFQVSPIDPVTQKSIVTFTANGDTGKTFSFESDINTGGDVNVTYAGNVTVDGSGNAVLLRSDEELDYSFEEQVSNAQGNYDEDFNDFTLSDLQSYVKDATPSTHTKFTVIKNSDICAVIDNATNTVLFVKEGLSSVTDKPTQFTVEADNNNDNLKITSTPFASIDVFSRFRLTNHSRDHKNDAKLIEKLLGK